MKKRLLSILLCLVMMVGLLSGAASAEGTTPITSLKFTLSGYTLGAKALDLKLTKDPGDVCIDIESVKVLKRMNSLEIVDPNEIFVPEMTYSVVIKLKARDGFDITTLTKENVKAVGADIEKTELSQIAGNPENERYVTFYFKPFDYLPVKDVAVTVTPPVLGAEITAEALSFTATGAVLRETTPTSWAIIRPEGSYNAWSTFVAGEVYEYRVFITPQELYKIYPDDTFTINGLAAELTVISDGEMGMLSYEFEPLEEAKAFTMQPAGGITPFRTEKEVSWKTNFTPLKVEKLRDGVVYGVLADPTATSAMYSAGPGLEKLRAYYGSGDKDYVESDEFSVSYEVLDRAISPQSFGIGGVGLFEPIENVQLNPDAANDGAMTEAFICKDREQIDNLVKGTPPVWYGELFQPDTDYYLVVRFTPEYGFDGNKLDKESISIEGYGKPDELIFDKGDTMTLGYAVFKLPQLTEKTISLELPFVKTVKQGGGVAPGEESFRLEIIRDGESVPAQYMKVSYSAAVTTNGVGDFSSKLVITGPESQVESFIDGGFYIREVKGYNDRWTYSDALWYARPYIDSGDSGDQLKLQIYSASIMSSDNGSYYVWNRENPVDKMSFENVYTFDDPVIKVEIPFTKTVKQGGTNAPNKQTFKLEIFDVGNGNADNYKDVSYTASVSTNGKGDYNGTMVITGPRSQVREFICEGFLVREVKGSASFWSYSDAVWAVIPEYDVENDVTKLYIYPTKAEKTEDGNHYVWEGMSAAGRMSFTNTYTYSPAAAPKTGDDSNMLLLCALLVTSGAAAVLWLEVIRRRRSDS